MGVVWLALACSSTGEPAPDSANAEAAIAQELRTAQAGRATPFGETVAFDDALTRLSSKFVADPAIRERLMQAYPTAFEHVGAEDLYVLTELGEVSVGGKVVLNVERVLEHLKENQQMPRANAANQSGDVGQIEQALVLNPVPPATRSISIGLYTLRGESKCSVQFSGDDYSANILTCQGSTRLVGPWYNPWSTPSMEHASVRVVDTTAYGAIEDLGWKNYPCPLVKCTGSRPFVRGEVRRAVDGASNVAGAVSYNRKCHGACIGDSIITFHAAEYGGKSYRFQTSTVSSSVDIDWKGYGQDYEVPWAYNGATCGGAADGWLACRGTGCAVCKEQVDAYPRYFTNHPNCVRNTACNGGFYRCSSNCPPPTAADL
jgi:hypothetical protein